MLSLEPTVMEAETMRKHFHYLKDLTEKGVFALAGPLLVTDYSNFGIGVLRASDHDAAWQIAENDPAVINRVMRLDVQPFSVLRYSGSYHLP